MTPCPPSTISAWGLSGPTREGETSTIQGIPYPQPEAMEVRLGAETDDGRQVMVSLINPVFRVPGASVCLRG